jgi:hypothetical protein
VEARSWARGGWGRGGDGGGRFVCSTTDWGELAQARDDRKITQASPDELPEIDIHSLLPPPVARHQESRQAVGLKETPHHARKTPLHAGKTSVPGGPATAS